MYETSDTRVGVWKSDRSAVEMVSYYDDSSFGFKSSSRNRKMRKAMASVS